VTFSLFDLGFVGALAPLWTPAQITTALWLDASDASTVTTISGAVSQWNDKSGNGRNVSQGTASRRPTVSSASINNNNALSFDGVNDFLLSNNALLPTGTSSRSMFVVYKPGRTTGVNGICGQSGTGATGAWFQLQFRSGLPTGDPYFAGFSADLTDSVAVTTNAKIAGVTYNGTQATLYRNGLQIAQSNLTLNTGSSELSVGASSSGGDEFNLGLIAEIVFASSFVSTNTRQLIEGYLAHKWDLAANLPSDHPYKSSPPTV
jgi:hypothetical protein